MNVVARLVSLFNSLYEIVIEKFNATYLNFCCKVTIVAAGDDDKMESGKMR